MTDLDLPRLLEAQEETDSSTTGSSPDVSPPHYGNEPYPRASSRNGIGMNSGRAPELRRLMVQSIDGGPSGRPRSQSPEFDEADDESHLSQEAPGVHERYKARAEAAEEEVAVLKTEVALLEAEVAIWSRRYMTATGALAAVLIGCVAIAAMRLGKHL